jgi:hypothetical protein
VENTGAHLLVNWPSSPGDRSTTISINNLTLLTPTNPNVDQAPCARALRSSTSLLYVTGYVLADS